MTPCPTGKQGYPSINAAWRVITAVSRPSARFTRESGGKPGGYAYSCDHCGQWHITSARRCLSSPRKELAV